MARTLPHICWFTAILALFFAGSAAGEVASIDVFFDLDRNMATGCDVSTSEGTVFGVEIRGRALFDVVPGLVTSSTTAICVNSETDLFGAEAAVLAPPTLPYGGVAGNGLGGSTLIEFAMPLTLFSEVATAAVYVEATSALGTDALLSYGSSAPIMSMNVFAVPGLVPALRVGLALLLVGLGGVRVSGKSPRTENRLVDGSARMWKLPGLLLLGALFAFPDVAQSLLGEGSQRNWSESSLVATDAVGDGTPALDLRGLYGRADAPAGRLWVRADVAFGPGICTDWGRSNPGEGFVCAQEPPIDQGGFSGAVALTFDDGPNPVTTPSVLTTLRAHGIPATFFVLGKKLVTPAERALALEIHQDPLFRLANHTVDHPFLPGNLRNRPSIRLRKPLSEFETRSVTPVISRSISGFHTGLRIAQVWKKCGVRGTRPQESTSILGIGVMHPEAGIAILPSCRVSRRNMRAI